MTSGSLVFPEGGIGGISTNYGSITLKNVNVQIKKVGDAEVDSVQDSEDDGPKSVGFLSHEGFVSFDNVTFNNSDAVVLWIRDDLNNIARQNVEYASVLSIEDVSPVEVADVSLADLLRPEYVIRNNNFLIPYTEKEPADSTVFADVVSTVSATLNGIYGDEDVFQVMGAFKISASMKSSDITVNGKESYGIYFEGETVGEEKDLLFSSEETKGARVVFLENTKFNVPNGLAIYGENLGGYVVLGKKSRLSGNLLLKAGPDSKLSVFAHDSSMILGGAVTDEDAYTEFFLSGNSSWHLIKNKYKGLQNSDAGNCIDSDSCISAISLVNSSIKFVSSQNDQLNAGGYQTLRIGDESDMYGVVYSGFGDSAIYLNAHVISDDSGHIQMVSDKLFIYGDVVGKTKVHVNDVVRRGGNSNTVRLEETQNEFHSVSLIRVYGFAKEDSFQLSSSYVTMQGSPYQYALRAHKIGNSGRRSGRDLGSNYTSGWDFRLESKVQDGDASIYLLNIPGSTINGVEEVAYTVVGGDYDTDVSYVNTNDDLSGSSILGRSETAEDLTGDLSPVLVLSTLPERSAPVESTGVSNPSSVETSTASSVSGNSISVGGGQPATLARSESSVVPESNVVFVVPMELYLQRDYNYDTANNYLNYIFKGPSGGFSRLCPTTTSSGQRSYSFLTLSSSTDNRRCDNSIQEDRTSEAVVVEIVPEQLYDPNKDVNKDFIIRRNNGSFQRHCSGGHLINLSSPTDKSQCGSNVTNDVSDNSAPVRRGQYTSLARSEIEDEVFVVSNPSSVETSTAFTEAGSAATIEAASITSGASTTEVVRSETGKPSTVISSSSNLESAASGTSAETAESESVPSKPSLDTSSVGLIESKMPVSRVQSFASPVMSRGPAPINSVVSANVRPTVSTQSEVSAKPAAPSVRPVGRVLLLDNAGKETVSAACSGTENNGLGESQTAYSCNDGQTHTVTDLTLKASDALQHPMHAKNQNTIIKLEGATIIAADSSDKNNVDLTKLQLVSTVLAEDGAEVVLDKKSTVKNSSIGLEAQKGGKVKMTDGTVNARYVGVLAGSGSSVNLSNTKINVTGDLAIAGLASNAGEATMNTGVITLTSGVAVRSESGGNVKLDNVKITAKKGQQDQPDSAETFGRAAFLVSDRGSVEFTNGYVSTDANGLWMRDSNDSVENSTSDTGTSRRKRSSDVRPSLNRAHIELSDVKVEGDKSYGIYFDGTGRKEGSQQNRNRVLEEAVTELSGTGSTIEKVSVVKRSTVSQKEKTPIDITGAVSLKKTRFEVINGIAIYGNNSGGQISLEENTILSGDLLLSAENNSHISVSVDDSIIEGWARIDKSSYAKLDLINKSEWILKRSVKRNFATPDSGCIDSCVSSIRLVNSTIDFVPSESEDLYQTLHIGTGNAKVYEAHGDVAIFLNARLNPRDPSDQQVTDRLVIHGDVEGKTRLHIRGVSDIVGEGKDNNQIAHSVSIIQVYGQAEKDSFQLDGNYVALANSPYKYVLRSYGPQLTAKQEHIEQKFIKDGGAFWNFRLENQYVKPSVPTDGLVLDERADGFVLPERVVRSVVPQVPTYLLLPNNLFHVGLMDIGDQNKQLETLRMSAGGMLEVHENPALFLRGYGGHYRYASDLSALEYGYGGHLRYNAVKAGILLKTIESADNVVSFGVMGSYGKLSLQPKNVEHSEESAFDKWSVTAYSTLQHDAGFYVDGLLSYGLFKGDVVTLARGKTATLKSKPLSVSLTGGQSFATGYEGFVVDPQVQVVYQNLQFDKARDIDNFDVEMGKLDQWVARVGGRLSKSPTGSEGISATSFYGKLYLVHGFRKKQSVHFKDAFQLGAFGSSLEAGLGFNTWLSPKFALHGDVVYQQKLTKAGFSGASFSGGLRYQF
ncbi:autotransporter outer membrane beta-barrel domain-containing protein [Bartonella henselae]|nr:autotransporter outer membrane beta-barrel domain-containing protein [Bartonella henselae]